MSKFYITTAIAYVNAPPHIGHALEFLQADVLARYHRLKSDDVFFMYGTDEHGVKVYETAQKEGMELQPFTDKYAEQFRELKDTFNLSNDHFIRTTEKYHHLGSQKIWKLMAERGDIYKDKYEGNYCVGCERFIPEKDLIDGKCEIHKTEPKVLEEENYFFRLSKYSDKIKAVIESGELEVLPENRKKEILNIIGEDGLYDVSFSRPKTSLPWGVEVPDDPEHVMYVWCDALSNYLNGIGYAEESEQFKKYWPADVHLIGKDILRFHAGIWIGMLMSAGLDLPKAVYAHGFVTSEGQKMSKSLGNVVNPIEYIEKYGCDALRYFLLREIPTTDDGDFSHDRFVNVHNSELANGMGNLLNRVVVMSEKYLGGLTPEKPENDEDVAGEMQAFLDKAMEGYEKFDLKGVCETVCGLVSFGNKYIDDKKPWAMAKENDVDLPVVIYNLIEVLKLVVLLILPIIPETAEKIAGAIGVDIKKLDLTYKWGELESGVALKKGPILFERIDV
ncbi:methionine--tRNA ligase [Candidatus Gracilibacteria bacterium]|nr:methionine--tRNA ligase [Candidatus Gracilibacteria bacterium]